MVRGPSEAGETFCSSREQSGEGRTNRGSDASRVASSHPQPARSLLTPPPHRPHIGGPDAIPGIDHGPAVCAPRRRPPRRPLVSACRGPGYRLERHAPRGDPTRCSGHSLQGQSRLGDPVHGDDERGHLRPASGPHPNPSAAVRERHDHQRRRARRRRQPRGLHAPDHALHRVGRQRRGPRRVQLPDGDDRRHRGEKRRHLTWQRRRRPVPGRPSRRRVRGVGLVHGESGNRALVLGPVPSRAVSLGTGLGHGDAVCDREQDGDSHDHAASAGAGLGGTDR